MKITKDMEVLLVSSVIRDIMYVAPMKMSFERRLCCTA